MDNFCLIFSIVLYKNNFEYIKPLLNSLFELKKLSISKGIGLKIYITDNSKSINTTKK